MDFAVALEMFPLAAESSPPAGGAALDQIVIANAMALAASGALAWLVLGHRSGKRSHLARLGAFSERVSGLPAWAALPSAISGISLVIALFGMYWDIALHIDVGRDAGPLANPAHYFILGGLFGIFCAGFIAMALPLERPGATAVRITSNWHAPLGGVLITACAFFSMLGFPLDDGWHHLFGQDVTLWGPTHLMLIGGAAMTLIGQAVLLAEGMRTRPGWDRAGKTGRVVRIRRVALMGGFLIGLSTFQAEFDFGVPQFQMIFQPVLIALAAGAALVCARIWIGAGGAFATMLMFVVLRGLLAVLVGPVLGETTPHLPLYLAEAACVELVGLWLARRPLALGAVSGVLIGTLGFAAEYGFSHLWMPVPWTPSLLPGAVVLATVGGVAGGLAGALTAQALQGRLPSRRVTRGLAVGSLAAVMALVGNGLVTTAPEGLRASFNLTEARGDGGGREIDAAIRLHPPTAADGERWLDITAWQGGGLKVDHLQRIREGVYRTTEPIPVHGDWKALLRLQVGRTLAGVPIYMPADPAIPAAAVPAPERFTRSFVADKQILQREVRRDAPGWLSVLAPLVVLAIALALLTVLALGLGRIGRPKDATGDAGRSSPQPTPSKGRRSPLPGARPA